MCAGASILLSTALFFLPFLLSGAVDEGLEAAHADRSRYPLLAVDYFSLFFFHATASNEDNEGPLHLTPVNE